jgi:hypothetical protein
MKPVRIIVGICLLMALAACGVVSLAYNNAPTAVAYVVDDWVDLTREQRDWLKPRVEKLMVWHRERELPAYQKLLTEAQDKVAKPVSLEHVDAFYGESRQAMERLAEKAMPDMVAFLQMLSPTQITFLEAKLAEDNDKLAKEIKLGLAERRAKRVERYVDRFEAWFGRLTPEQLVALKTTVEAMPFSEELRMVDRKRWQTGMMSLLKQKADAQTLERELRVLLLTPETRRAEEYRVKWALQQQIVTRLTAEFLQTATPKQRQAVKRKLAGYADDVSSLLKS